MFRLIPSKIPKFIGRERFSIRDNGDEINVIPPIVSISERNLKLPLIAEIKSFSIFPIQQKPSSEQFYCAIEIF